PKVLGLFQASFYFFYDDQFAPGIRQNLASAQGGPDDAPSAPRLDRITILSSTGGVIYDSVTGAEGKTAPAGQASAATAPAAALREV
ncbi:hypothetical protein ABTE18_20385, partial [Acinetobacter baumannii]